MDQSKSGSNANNQSILRPRIRSRSWTSSLWSICTRLFIWYIALTALFRCPSSIGDLTSASPQLCRPLLTARFQVEPYFKPYYDQYLSHYVDAGRPYYDTLYSKVYTPAATVAKDNFAKYGASRIAQARNYGQKEWGTMVKPHLDSAKANIRIGYNSSLVPLVVRGFEASFPYLLNGKNAIVHQYQSNVIPLYTDYKPRALKAYNRGHQLSMDVILPYSRWVNELITTVLRRRIWPPMRILYGENVEPQLVRIRARLARYRDGKKLEAAVDKINSFSDKSILSVPVASSSTPFRPTGVDSKTSTSAIEKAPITSAHAATLVTSVVEREKIAEDLKIWQEKFATASDKGADDLMNRVDQIISQQISSQVHGVGQALVIQLEEASDKALGSLKTTIHRTIASLPEDATDEDLNSANENVRTAIRSAGKVIRDKAQSLRAWKLKYDEQTESLVKAASDSTLGVMDSIRDLGLQEIGLRWASMDGVTYKDWSEYHALKKTFEELRRKVEGAAEKNEGLTTAKKEGDAVELRGMTVAENAAKELSRLKDVANWKIGARDMNDNWNSEPIFAGGTKLSGGNVVSGDTLGAKQGLMSASSLSSKASEGVVDPISSVLPDMPKVKSQSTVSSKLSGAAADANDFSSKADNSNGGTGVITKVPVSIEEAAAVSSSALPQADSNSAENLISRISEEVERANQSGRSAMLMAKDKLDSMTGKGSETRAEVTNVAPANLPNPSSATSPYDQDAPGISETMTVPSGQSVLSAPKKKTKTDFAAARGSRPPPVIGNSEVSGAAGNIGDPVISVAEDLKNLVSAQMPEGTIAPAVLGSKVGRHDIVEDVKLRASKKIQSAVAEAGDQYVEMTESFLHHATAVEPTQPATLN